MGDTKSDLTISDIEAYLAANPDLFIREPQLIELLELNEAPVGTLSFAKKQVERLQYRNAQLAEQLAALIENAHRNTDLEKQIHGLCLKVLDSHDLNHLVKLLEQELKQDFAADEVMVCFLHQDNHQEFTLDLQSKVLQFAANDAKLNCFDHLISQQKTICGRLTKAQKQLLFAERAEQVESVACLPLGHQPCIGILAIASSDPNRFHADMATDYLSLLGEVVMRVIRQLTGPHHS